MHVTATFDSNVWRQVVSPYAFPKDPSAKVFDALNNFARKGVLKGYLAEAIFNLEAIPRKLRSGYFGEYRPKYDSTPLKKNGDGSVHFGFSIGPNMTSHSGNSDYLKKHLTDALALGFTLLSAPRIGTPRSPDVSSEMYGSRTESEMKAQQELCFDVFETLDILGCGIAQIRALGARYRKGDLSWMDALDRAPKDEHHLIAKAIAEWADGDAVAAHISYRLDYFCTRDAGISAGPTSVFSPTNRDVLLKKYGITFITPEELLERIQDQPSG